MDIDLDKWYRCKIDKKEFKKLCKKSDWQGFKHMIIYFSSLGIFGYLAYATWGTWWSLLFFLIYGNIWGCADALWHETGHRTAFKTKFWNDFFYYIASFMDNFEPIRWRYSHFHHHSHRRRCDAWPAAARPRPARYVQGNHSSRPPPRCSHSGRSASSSRG